MPRTMGILRHIQSGKKVILPPHAVAGRALTSSILLTAPASSNDHASISWTGDRWEARDLGSTNGTLVGDLLLQPKEGVPLAAGTVLRFGCDAERWELVDPSGPGVVARSPTTGEERTAEHGLLALPGPEGVLVSVVLDIYGKWTVETPDGARRPAVDGERIAAGGKTWVLAVPPEVGGGAHKAKTAKTGLSLGSLTLVFHVSPDERHVHVEVRDGNTSVTLKERACFFLLLLLARHRLEDVSRHLPGDEQGWMHVVEAGSRLRKDELRVNSDVHRARELLANAGLEGADRIVERRPREIRIGTGRLVVSKP
jgi:pSer/pThr/pTyr-binding forkhead associated (FHA) protein